MSPGANAGPGAARARLELDRHRILAFRRRVGGLEERLPWGEESLRRAAWAGLQDSMPRAALLSIHARVEGTCPNAWEDPSLVQLWGPRFSAYVVAARDRAVFTRGRQPDDARRRQVGEDLADRLGTLLRGERMEYRRAGRALGEPPNRLRYAAPTGRLLLRWDGARKPVVWTVPPPDIEAGEALLELARRYLHVFGPSTPEAFAKWAGIPERRGVFAFETLGSTLTPVRTPIGEGWILARDESAFRAAPGPAAPARLLPSGDAYFLLQGAERALLVPDADRRQELWPSRVWPGAVLVDGDVVGTWRRAGHAVTVQTWQPPSQEACRAIEAEARSLPLPGVEEEVVVLWAE